MHLYIWPRNSFSSPASCTPSRYTSLLILARNYVVTIPKGIKTSVTNRIYIYVCVYSRIKVHTTASSLCTFCQHTSIYCTYSSLIIWYTRPVCVCTSIILPYILFIIFFTLSVDRRRHRRLSWLWHCRNDCDDTVEIVVAIYTVSHQSTVVHRLLWGRWVLADRRLQSYLNQIDWKFSSLLTLATLINYEGRSFSSSCFFIVVSKWIIGKLNSII